MSTLMGKAKKTMLVTGASRGIGAEIALLAARSGYRVGVNYLRSEKAAHDVVKAIAEEGGEAVALQADVSRLDEVVTMFERLDAAFGKLDVLVNNAGVLANFRVDAVDEHNVADVFAANVFSTYYCSREAIRRMSTMQGGKGGVIINMSSVASRLGGLGGGAAYAASKAAIDTFTLALGKEVGGEGIRVNAIRPGLIATEIHDLHGGIEKMQQMARTAVPLGRSGSAAEVADVALWLASDASSYVHGTVIDVAGGR
ncbi:MAG: SDR family oxidoreductase [Polaromonas sp.]|uniref:SDR family oxidoreductase n=1 Tax=Polaromonas sp. TaxID=1869339 RepID=UPI0025F73F61|nr:SDR family oxidoreductase [Polaromonas sp.]MBI2727672.1 SDR family oxidoreductase [Polaromonas sp.]